MIDEKTLAHKRTAQEMAEAYTKTKEIVEHAYRLLADAEADLHSVFATHTWSSDITLVNYRAYWDYERHQEYIDGILIKLKKAIWTHILNLLEIRKITSIKRTEEIDKQINDGTLPEPTVENIFTVFMDIVNGVETMKDELLIEAYNFLRPRRSEYKTNSAYGVNKKVILQYIVEHKIVGKGFCVKYARRDILASVEKVFRLLDGQGPLDIYSGHLVNAIETNSQGETDYFKFKCYNNGNLHLEFKRLDLLTELNKIAGANMLPV